MSEKSLQIDHFKFIAVKKDVHLANERRKLVDGSNPVNTFACVIIVLVHVMSLLDVYLLIGGIHGVIQSIFLFSSSRRNVNQGAYLGFFILSFSLILIVNSLRSIEGPVSIPNLVSLPFMFSGFSIYLYAKALLSMPISRKETLLHAIPFIIFFLVFILDFLSHRIRIIPSLLSSNPYINNIILNLLGAIHMLIYLVRTRNLLTRKSGDQNNAKVSWIAFLLTSSMIVCFMVVFLVALLMVTNNSFDQRLAYLVWVVMSLIIYSIGYAGIRRPELFSKTVTETLPALSVFQKYRNTSLTEMQLSQLKKGLDEAFGQHHLHKNPDLTLGDLSKFLGLRPNIVSRYINQYQGMNFNQFVNQYRLLDIKRMLADEKYDKYSILGIAFEAGFSSKSAFNAYFQRQTGTSPADYRNKFRQVEK